MTNKSKEGRPGIDKSKAVSQARADWDRCQREVQLAIERLGEKSSQAMEWIVAFAQRDISALSEGDLLNLRFEVKAFSEYGIGSKQKGAGKPQFDLSRTIEDDPDDSTEKTTVIDSLLPSWNEIEHAQTHVRKILEDLTFTNVTEINLVNLRISVATDEDDNDPRGQLYFVAPNTLAAFQYNLVQLLGEHAGRVKQCPECQKIFLADRRNQQYCSLRCQSRQATRKYRNTPSDRIGKRGRPPKRAPTPTGTVQVKPTKGKGKVKFKKSVGKEKSHGKRRR